MSASSRRLENLTSAIHNLHDQELATREPMKKTLYRVLRWVMMIRHQFVADDVRIRSESLTFLMTFSLLPLIAGAFFVFTMFTRFGMVQQALQQGLAGFLDTIPAEHRAFVLDYILKFKDAYLASLGRKSGSFGIFALFILVWVGLKFFANIERTLNHIWSADRERSFVEQLRNFLVVTVAAPLVLISGLSVPLVLHNIPATRYLLDNVKLLSALLNHIVPSLLIFVTFAALYKYVPVRRVKWQSAAAGALFAMICVELTNFGMAIYFRIGTNTAYGKLAVVPLLGFWIYVVWIVVILGAEVSFLMQNEAEILATSLHEPTFREGEALLVTLHELYRAFQSGRNPVAFETLQMLTHLKASRLRLLIQHLKDRGLVLECSRNGLHVEGSYALARDISEVPISDLLTDFFEASWHTRGTAGHELTEAWREGLRKWTSAFEQSRIASL